jgi:hypothetical protein
MLRALKIDGRVIITDVLYWNGTVLWHDLGQPHLTPETYPQWLKDRLGDGSVEFVDKVIQRKGEDYTDHVIRLKAGEKIVDVELDQYFSLIELPYQEPYWEWFSENSLYFAALTSVKDGDLTFYFEAPPNGRFLRYGRSITMLWASGESKDTFWWSDEKKRWVGDEERRADYDRWRAKWDGADTGVHWSHSSHSGRIRTFKAFKRHIRKHRHNLSGQLMVWVNNYEDQSVYVRIP